MIDPGFSSDVINEQHRVLNEIDWSIDPEDEDDEDIEEPEGNYGQEDF